MLIKPPTCQGCPLLDLGSGFMAPTLAGEDRYKVTLLGEALGEDEAESGKPFTGRAGFKLTRLIEWAGLDRSRFDIINSAWCRPPANRLEGEWYEAASIAHCRERHWQHLLGRSNVVVPLGNVALAALTGRKGILRVRGYVQGGAGYHILPTVHPSFIQRGQAKYSAPFINDLRKAVDLADRGLPPEPTDYTIDPLPMEAYAWAQEYRRLLSADPSLRLAYDIETPGKGEDEGENGIDDDPTYFIHRIGFAYKPLHALTVPWTPSFIPAIRLLLESDGEKVVWNGGFDNPRIRANGVGINGLIHDGMVAWHVLHSDLPKGLGFVATFTCPWQHEWKSMSGRDPGRYNCIDADVELRSMLWIEKELQESGLWDVYKDDVLDLDPILVHMTREGMPIDGGVRSDRAAKLAERLATVRERMARLTPLSIRTFTPKEGYVRTPDQTEGLVTIRVTADVARCAACGAVNPTAPHFNKKTFARPGTPGRKKEDRVENPCYGSRKEVKAEEVERFAKLDPYKPSRELLLRYQKAKARIIPTVFDKRKGERKASMDEKAIKGLMRRYPEDELYPLVLEYRELDKLASTYIGRPINAESVV